MPPDLLTATPFLLLQIYIESFYVVPKGLCRSLVKYMAWCFFVSWVGFPIIFLAGPDGFGHITIWAEVVGKALQKPPQGIGGETCGA